MRRALPATLAVAITPREFPHDPRTSAQPGHGVAAPSHRTGLQQCRGHGHPHRRAVWPRAEAARADGLQPEADRHGDDHAEPARAMPAAGAA
ncbi:hypothetical protein G6F22_019731 [Rhizopus arrhizus]|uniref:Uncharacterized protein n=1 Tax=Rhizopus delemar TaxID=936053 RepID=A0A9P6XTV3_9FUNG|nr:hypothetical protein G6F22_019731 [Rhizopus arrhizus]KAG0938912.1 hypothetical protein G6F31_015379 [Rhizopus arrhizus]KAG1271986.1 hypothetical protein G6F65_012027 [Rhizopus arrhizus]KAG1532394.1 hypothetical protein G6F50_016234 [Rhizopus delemar]